MTNKLFNLTAAVGLSCLASTAMASSTYTLTTINNLNSISTLLVGAGSTSNSCSDSPLIQLNEVCEDATIRGETPANGSSTCKMTTTNLKIACGEKCTVKIYDQAHCKGNFATGTLHVTSDQVNLTDISNPAQFIAQYSSQGNLAGELTLKSTQ